MIMERLKIHNDTISLPAAQLLKELGYEAMEVGDVGNNLNQFNNLTYWQGLAELWDKGYVTTNEPVILSKLINSILYGYTISFKKPKNILVEMTVLGAWKRQSLKIT